MDGVHFDHLARRLSRASRRDCLRRLGAGLLAGLGGRASATAAQLAGAVTVGGVCSATVECRQRDMQHGAVCADNGFASDGARNCCLSEGGGQACCESDADCCGSERCAPTADVCHVCRQPPFPTRVRGQLCTADSDCVQSAACQFACVASRCTCLSEAPGQVAPGGPPLPDVPDAETALAVAEELSALEAAGQFDALYERMHPDAQRVIPRPAVVGWYQAELAPLGPAPATAIKVRFIPWTWAVTGQTYPDTAEVAFQQRFADGTVVRDEIRLVKDWHGNWSWFFGRDRAFVEAQIARFGR